MTEKKTLADYFEEVAAWNAAEYDRLNTPEKIAERKEKAEREFRRGVELGWWDEDGNSLLEDDEPDEDEDDEDNGEDNEDDPR